MSIAESLIHRPVSTQEFVDAMAKHRIGLKESQEKLLTPRLIDLTIKARTAVSDALELKPDRLAVIFGEQTYGLNEPPKVLGKRLLAKALENGHGIQTVEMFASFDSVGSEPGIYRMQVPNPQNSDGFQSLSVLTGWKDRKHSPTASFRSPTEEEIVVFEKTLCTLYGRTKAGSLVRLMSDSFRLHGDNYANANIDILRRAETLIGLEIERFVTEDVLDTKIARNGGMEVILHLWRKLTVEGRKLPSPAVRVPSYEEAPFWLYHENEECQGRMQVEFHNLSENYSLNLESPLSATCLGCGHKEHLTPGVVVEEGRTLTWMAIPRVFLYSTLGIADGHITGGGSVYNEIVNTASRNMGITYFPLIWMARNNDNGERWGLFQYKSFSVTRKDKLHRMPGYPKAVRFVNEGRAAMADLFLSIGVGQLRNVVEDALAGGIDTKSRLECPEPEDKGVSPI